MTDKRTWITDRLPTEADADQCGDVIVCTSPTLHKELKSYMVWRIVTPGWPWRHTEYWTPPTPDPELTPAAPEFRVGQVWRTRDGQTCKIIRITETGKYPIATQLYRIHWHWPNGRSCLGSGDQDQEDDLIELISENPPTPAAPEPKPEAEEDSPPEPVYIYAERATRGFAWFSRVNADEGHAVEEYAVATDGTAWWRFVGKDDRLEDKEWVQIRPLPQPGEE